MKDVCTILETLTYLLEGLGKNLLITVAAAFIPLLLGIVLSLLAGRHKIIAAVFGWLSLPSEVLSPLLMMTLLFCGPAMVFHETFDRTTVAIVALAICSIAYMPARYNSDSSTLKNVCCNGLGLLIHMFKWSFVARAISVMELSWHAEYLLKTAGDVLPLIIAFVLTAIVLIPLEAARLLCNQLLGNKTPRRQPEE